MSGCFTGQGSVHPFPSHPGLIACLTVPGCGQLCGGDRATGSWPWSCGWGLVVGEGVVVGAGGGVPVHAGGGEGGGEPVAVHDGRPAGRRARRPALRLPGAAGLASCLSRYRRQPTALCERPFTPPADTVTRSGPAARGNAGAAATEARSSVIEARLGGSASSPIRRVAVASSMSTTLQDPTDNPSVRDPSGHQQTQLRLRLGTPAGRTTGARGAGPVTFAPAGLPNAGVRIRAPKHGCP